MKSSDDINNFLPRPGSRWIKKNYVGAGNFRKSRFYSTGMNLNIPYAFENLLSIGDRSGARLDEMHSTLRTNCLCKRCGEQSGAAIEITDDVTALNLDQFHDLVDESRRGVEV